ncbi:hypothetical protein [Mesorhizobium sp.]|nr:hypothetical protein [Mesorhizobium sp.]TIM06948.1 MAG: hypothetical protein E5Y62_21840 [Mesorhizobium sp.]
MLAQADACNRRQNPEAASPLPGRKVGHLTERFTRPARMAADLFPPPLSLCWTMIFFEKAFALCEVMLYF